MQCNGEDNGLPPWAIKEREIGNVFPPSATHFQDWAETSPLNRNILSASRTHNHEDAVGLEDLLSHAL